MKTIRETLTMQPSRLERRYLVACCSLLQSLFVVESLSRNNAEECLPRCTKLLADGKK